MKIIVNETFGPTIQGEGINAGQLVGFLRLANCNLACSWCDTPYSWNWDKYDKKIEAVEYDTKDVADIVRLWGVNRVIISGGEPMLQQEAIAELIKIFNGEVSFDIETNGTIAPLEAHNLGALVDTFSVSPKLSHSGDIEKKRLKQKALQEFVRISKEDLSVVVFKFVIQKPSDLEEVKDIVAAYKISDRDVWIMPEGTTVEKQIATLQEIADSVIEAGYNLSSRLHVLAWGNKRGV